MAGETVIVREMIEAFKSAPIVREELSTTGISFLSVEYLGERLTASWYASGAMRELVYSGGTYFADEVACKRIVIAARERAKQLFSERQSALEQKRREYIEKHGKT